MLSVEIDPLYVAARRVLLDAAGALGEHCGALVLVGAQAVYLRAGDADLHVVAPYTTDADLSVDPAQLDDDPAITAAMTAAGFTLKIKVGGNGVEPGAWQRSTNVGGVPQTIEVDLMVPEALAPGHGSRDARLPHHGKNATRWAAGLEAAVLDNTAMAIASLEPDHDPRTTVLRVAGEAALLMAKAHKLGERLAAGTPDRIKPKDAGDVFRLMRAPATPSQAGARLAELGRHPDCTDSVAVGVGYLADLFGRPRARGVELAVQNLAAAVSEDELREVMPHYMDELLAAYRAG
ncbi:hypothetical protein ACFFX1_10880 [Dactylosporangium sucinum]|uniref:Nucleotidyltransferase n=1 Tax=Dactylosporangium sucinum TaxID=1424081 RepID=A0A917TGP5_9ACTN|nr:hypothetical protein [Dactylosporangium sucinum]GGM22828.1 hypothetical protein GCM10007977_025040 [Dactylosporangium sucinum]